VESGCELLLKGRATDYYLACSTMEEYLLVDSQSMRIEIYRKEQKKWMYDAFEADDMVELASMSVLFPVIDAYEDVVFEKEGNKKRSGK
jgi:Uma2 family endonuclease